MNKVILMILIILSVSSLAKDKIFPEQNYVPAQNNFPNTIGIMKNFNHEQICLINKVYFSNVGSIISFCVHGKAMASIVNNKVEGSFIIPIFSSLTNTNLDCECKQIDPNVHPLAETFK